MPSRAFTSAYLLSRLRKETDAVNDTHITDAEGYEALTSAVASTWDTILASDVGDHFVKKVTFNTVPNQLEYPIDSVCTALDFYKVNALYVDEGNGQLRPINRINPYEEQAYRSPSSAVPMVLYYTPVAPIWTTGFESFDGINGWEEHVICNAAIFIKNKKEDDDAPWQRKKREIEARISAMANRSRGEPPRVVRKRYQQFMDSYAPWRNNVSAWDLRGANFELFYRFGYTGR